MPGFEIGCMLLYGLLGIGLSVVVDVVELLCCCLLFFGDALWSLPLGLKSGIGSGMPCKARGWGVD